MRFVQPQPFDEAVRKLGQRRRVASAMNSAAWRDVPVALRERAFFSATVTSARFVDRAKHLVDSFLQGAREEDTGPDGVRRTALRTGSRADFVAEMMRLAKAEGLGVDLPKGVAGEDRGMIERIRDVQDNSRLKLIFETQVRQAYGYGAWKQGTNPEMLRAFPAMRFIRGHAVDEPRPKHEANRGTVRRKDDVDFWLDMNSRDIGGFEVPWGPWGFNSGMDTRDVRRSEARALGLIEDEETPGSPQVDFNETMQAQLSGMDTDVVRRLRRKLGRGFEIETDGPVEIARPRPRPRPTAKKTPRGKELFSPVSKALGWKVRDRELKRTGQQGAELIDRVHDDGLLPPLAVSGRRTADAYGHYQPSAGTLRPPAINLSPDGAHPKATFLHEIGHFLDQHALGGDTRRMATQAGDPEVTEILRVIQESPEWKWLRDQERTSTGRQRRYLSYLTSPVEAWARAYAQFVAEESGDAEALEQVRASSGGITQPGRPIWDQVNGARQWTEGAFRPIKDAIRRLFRKKGWIKE